MSKSAFETLDISWVQCRTSASVSGSEFAYVLQFVSWIKLCWYLPETS